jgi:hypothetical protein
VETYRQAFQALPAAEQLQALEAALQVHAWRGRATEAAEASDLAGARLRPRRKASALPGRRGTALVCRASARASPERQQRTDANCATTRATCWPATAPTSRWVAANSAWLSPVWLATGARAVAAGLRDEDLAQAVAARSDCPKSTVDSASARRGCCSGVASARPDPAIRGIGPPLRVKRLQVSDADGPRLLDPAAAPQRVAPLASLAAAAPG